MVKNYPLFRQGFRLKFLLTPFYKFNVPFFEQMGSKFYKFSQQLLWPWYCFTMTKYFDCYNTTQKIQKQLFHFFS